MKLCLIISLIFTLAIAARAAVSQGFFKDPKHPGKCVVDDLIVSAGETVNPYNGCGRMMCGSEGFASFHTCGVEGAPEGYKLGEPVKPNAPYPDCCHRHLIPV